MEKTLNKSLKLPVRASYPVKRSINLAIVGQKKINYKVLIPLLILIIALAATFSKFAVIDRLVAVSEAQAEENRLQNLLDSTLEEIDSYADLEDTYAHYTHSDMTEDELALADRTEVLELIDRIVLPQATVSSFSIDSNELKITVIGSSLEHLNQIASQLEEEDIVDYCIVSTATTNSTYTDESAQEVTGQVLIYLVNTTEEEN